MPPDPARLDEARAWLVKAALDLRAADPGVPESLSADEAAEALALAEEVYQRISTVVLDFAG